jgi:hypothetical protein
MKQILEEAKREYIEKHVSRNEYASFGAAFEAGAEWQKKQSPWTLVKDKLPDESELVLCRMVSNEAIVSGFIFISPDGLPCVATLPNFEFDDYSGYVCDMWMPIPKFN